jgi:hypothetical protein
MPRSHFIVVIRERAVALMEIVFEVDAAFRARPFCRRRFFFEAVKTAARLFQSQRLWFSC